MPVTVRTESRGRNQSNLHFSREASRTCLFPLLSSPLRGFESLSTHPVIRPASVSPAKWNYPKLRRTYVHTPSRDRETHLLSLCRVQRWNNNDVKTSEELLCRLRVCIAGIRANSDAITLFDYVIGRCIVRGISKGRKIVGNCVTSVNNSGRSRWTIISLFYKFEISHSFNFATKFLLLMKII